MTLAIIGRADDGGIAAQTIEMARHCRPRKVLVVDLGDGPRGGRGVTRPERFAGSGAELRVTNGYPSDADLDWLLDRIDCVYTVENCYRDHLPALAERRAVRLVIHGNPELWDERLRAATTELVLPTTWERRRVKPAVVMPIPVARDRLPYRPRTAARRFLFPRAEAMEDRAGERLLMAALRHVRSPVTVVLSPTARRNRAPKRVGEVTLKYAGPRAEYWEYPDADVLVHPRRYGGLSLPLQEAASLGMGAIHLDVEPYCHFLHPAGLVPARIEKAGYPMKGGSFSIYGCSPRDLAAAIDRLANDPGLVAEMSHYADAWAAALDWKIWEGEWRRFLRA